MTIGRISSQRMLPSPVVDQSGQATQKTTAPLIEKALDNLRRRIVQTDNPMDRVSLQMDMDDTMYLLKKLRRPATGQTTEQVMSWVHGQVRDPALKAAIKMELDDLRVKPALQQLAID